MPKWSDCANEAVEETIKWRDEQKKKKDEK